MIWPLFEGLILACSKCGILVQTPADSMANVSSNVWRHVGNWIEIRATATSNVYPIFRVLLQETNSTDACPPRCTLYSRHPHTESVAASASGCCKSRQRAVRAGAHGPQHHPERGCDCYRAKGAGNQAVPRGSNMARAMDMFCGKGMADIPAAVVQVSLRHYVIKVLLELIRPNSAVVPSVEHVVI